MPASYQYGMARKQPARPIPNQGPDMAAYIRAQVGVFGAPFSPWNQNSSPGLAGAATPASRYQNRQIAAPAPPAHSMTPQALQQYQTVGVSNYTPAQYEQMRSDAYARHTAEQARTAAQYAAERNNAAAGISAYNQAMRGDPMTATMANAIHQDPWTAQMFQWNMLPQQYGTVRPLPGGMGGSWQAAAPGDATAWMMNPAYMPPR